MKIRVAMVVVGMLCGNAMAQQGSTATTPKPAASAGGTAAKSTAKATAGSTRALVTTKDRQSYAVGLNAGMRMKQMPIDLDPSLVAQGLKDAMSGAKPAMTDDEAKAVLTDLQGELQKKQEAMMAQMGSANKKEGEAFLAANKSKDGVVTLPSGLQ